MLLLVVVLLLLLLLRCVLHATAGCVWQGRQLRIDQGLRCGTVRTETADRQARMSSGDAVSAVLSATISLQHSQAICQTLPVSPACAWAAVAAAPTPRQSPGPAAPGGPACTAGWSAPVVCVAGKCTQGGEGGVVTQCVRRAQIGVGVAVRKSAPGDVQLQRKLTQHEFQELTNQRKGVCW